MSEGTFNPDKVRKIGEFAQTSSSEYRVAINTFGDRNHVDMRQWYKKKTAKEFMPGKGFSIPVEHLPDLIRTLKKAHKRAIKAGLLEADE